MIYKFKDVDGKEIGQTTTTSQTLAKEIAKEQGWDWYSIDILEETKGEKVVEPESNVTNTLDETPKKTRKPRADKGQPRVKVDNKSKNVDNVSKKKVAKKDRKHPEYFIYHGGLLTKALTHQEALQDIGESEDKTPRVIMGHEIKFVRKVQFKMS